MCQLVILSFTSQEHTRKCKGTRYFLEIDHSELVTLWPVWLLQQYKSVSHQITIGAIRTEQLHDFSELLKTIINFISMAPCIQELQLKVQINRTHQVLHITEINTRHQTGIEK